MTGQMLVLHFWWTEGSTARQETYGPWITADDDSHLEQIAAFLKDWRHATGCEPSSVTMALVMNPAAITGIPEGFVAVRESWTPQQIEEFRQRWSALHAS